ncbi:DUF4062 domain-containing protein [Kaistella sp. 97-N-M2]|uniref:DUF4062 domain-containing protein n=1 Tax=Kaistella sp. 97-N-M2 TaxID=2908645 RepID=UPI001F2BAC12|nr:DUF4062 domain-containing protein [Kaistella sp. 97-N-M2]UJF29878.1 DUF4062 domain-containing protein [Kaistella sp. 97-N-M2]
MNNLNVFVSSTCFDLSQIRSNLKDFIEQFGHNPVLSETNNFPVEPNLDAVENCIKNVHEFADIFVLIIGNRYGSIIETGKSITNTEYLTAQQKGIPIFCFIDKKILNALSFYRDNKDGNYTKIVDNVQIFDFVDDIRSKANRWVFDFDDSKEIISTLKIQLSYLFKDSLKVKKIFDTDIDDFFKEHLSIKCLKILVEKKSHFEIDFLAQTFIDEIEKKEFLKNDIEYSILTEPKHYISDNSELTRWASNRLKAVGQITSNLSSLFPVVHKFIGELGQPSDIKGLYYVSLKYAQIFEQLLNWMIDVKSTSVKENQINIKIYLADMAFDVLKTLWDFPFGIKRQLENIKKEELLGNTITTIDLNMKLQLNEAALNKFNAAILELSTQINNEIN